MTEWLNQGLEVQGQDQGLTFKAKARTNDSTRKAKDRTKDWRFKAKARTKDWNFVLKDNQGQGQPLLFSFIFLMLCQWSGIEFLDENWRKRQDVKCSNDENSSIWNQKLNNNLGGAICRGSLGISPLLVSDFPPTGVAWVIPRRKAIPPPPLPFPTATLQYILCKPLVL